MMIIHNDVNSDPSAGVKSKTQLDILQETA